MSKQYSTRQQPLGFPDYLFVALQYLLPHHLLSLMMYWITRSEWRPFKDWLIHHTIDWFRIDLSQALEPDPGHYRSFNDFFTRQLGPDARPLAGDSDTVVCPADGTLSQYGTIDQGRIFQAKGRDFSLLELLGGDQDWHDRLTGGSFATIYLSPRDYHRAHMPLSGTLKRMVHVPGRLFSVNPTTVRLVPRLFARNERVVCLFETAAGPMAVILVGAIFVASIDTVWAGTVTPRRRRVTSWDYSSQAAELPEVLGRGQEMGRFNMGSTVMVLFGREAVEWSDSIAPGMQLHVGEMLGGPLTRPDDIGEDAEAAAEDGG